ncbi:hypothetical protein SDC9_128119 [bioreactor metagenome]|uniref:Uncharacterized protein n=1 Tax=bioreactor metagenome TaxID=1076179 RepID=A0A645CVX6_9ZZZZ
MVELRIGVGMQRLPVADGGIPFATRGRQGAALDVADGLVVHGHQTCAGAAFDGHVADRHAAFHAQVADGFAGKLYGVARAAGGADLADDGQHDVLGGDAGRDLAVDLNQHVLGLLGQQGLGGHHMFDLGGADAERDRTEGAVGGGVRVAADDGHARLGQAQLRADDVHHTLVEVTQGVDRQTELPGVGTDGVQLQPGDRVGDRRENVVGGRVVILGEHGQLGAADAPARLPQAVEGLGAGHLMGKLQVDVEQVGLSFRGADHMVLPDLLTEGLTHRTSSIRINQDDLRRESGERSTGKAQHTVSQSEISVPFREIIVATRTGSR